MATIDAASVKKLREMTSVAMMDCKRALVEADGDIDKAVTILRRKGAAGAEKKASRATEEGSIGLAISDDFKRGALVEINCETDFVAKNDKFQELCAEVAQVALNSDVSDAQGLMNAAHEAGSVEDRMKTAIAALGENIRIGRVARYETQGYVGHYIHHDRKQAALVELTGGSGDLAELGRDLSTQIVALRPQFANRDEIPADVLEAEKNIYAQQAAAEGKPEAIQQKIAEGRLSKEFYGQVSLMDQPFIKEQKQTVAQHVKATSPGVQVARFVRFKVGEA